MFTLSLIANRTNHIDIPCQTKADVIDAYSHVVARLTARKNVPFEGEQASITEFFTRYFEIAKEQGLTSSRCLLPAPQAYIDKLSDDEFIAELTDEFSNSYATHDDNVVKNISHTFTTGADKTGKTLLFDFDIIIKKQGAFANVFEKAPSEMAMAGKDALD